MWGRDVQFQGTHGTGGAQGVEAAYNSMPRAAKRKHTLETEAQERLRIAHEVNAIAEREQDYELFTLLAERYGPLGTSF